MPPAISPTEAALFWDCTTIQLGGREDHQILAQLVAQWQGTQRTGTRPVQTCMDEERIGGRRHL
jgi:hypothetical protein